MQIILSRYNKDVVILRPAKSGEIIRISIISVFVRRWDWWRGGGGGTVKNPSLPHIPTECSSIKFDFNLKSGKCSLVVIRKLIRRISYTRPHSLYLFISPPLSRRGRIERRALMIYQKLERGINCIWECRCLFLWPPKPTGCYSVIDDDTTATRGSTAVVLYERV